MWSSGLVCTSAMFLMWSGFQVFVLLQMVCGVVLHLVLIDELNVFRAARLAIDHGFCGLAADKAM